MTDDELDLIETDELLRGLARRSMAVVACFLIDRDADNYEAVPFYVGGPHICSGLARHLQLALDAEMMEASAPGEDEVA